jgi:hypothetical protein
MKRTLYEFTKEARRAAMGEQGMHLSSLEAMALAQRWEKLEIENEQLKKDLATCSATIDRFQAKLLKDGVKRMGGLCDLSSS